MNGTDGGNRTHTPLRALDFESSASASSATSALEVWPNSIHRLTVAQPNSLRAPFAIAPTPDCLRTAADPQFDAVLRNIHRFQRAIHVEHAEGFEEGEVLWRQVADRERYVGRGM